MDTGTLMKPRRGLFRGKLVRGLIAALILGVANAADVRAQSAAGLIGKVISADPQVTNAAQAAEEALKTVATQGESTRGATGAIGQLITESDTLICSAWIISFRTRYRDMVIEANADGELDTREAEALRAMERLMSVVEKTCDKVLNAEAYENLVTAEEATLATQASVPQVVCPECEALREAYEQRSYEYQVAQLALSRSMGRSDFVNDVYGRNLTPRQRATATGGETPEEAATHEARKREEARNAQEKMELAKKAWLDCVQRCHDANRRQYGLRDPGLSKNAKIGIGAGAALVVGVVALSGGSDTTTNPPANTPPPNVSGFYGNYTATLVIGNSSINRCGQAETAQIPVTLTGNPDGSGFILSKGGLPFAGVMRPNGSFEVVFAGGINGFPGLPNGTGVNWPIRGMVTGTQLSATGQVTVTTGNCSGAVLQSSLNGMRS